MKAKKIFTLLAGIALLGSLSACDSDDDISSSSVPTAVRTTFTKMYPSAKSTSWDKDGQYYVADFSNKGFDLDAWYTKDGTWSMTETDYGSITSYLPMAVQDAFNNSQYADWIVDDAELYERQIESFCVIEVETVGMPEIALFYDTYGILLNEVQGSDFDIRPNTVVENITF